MTTSTNLNKLNYPLFKITLNDAWLLTEARKHLRDTKRGIGETFLCFALDLVQEEYPEEKNRIANLQHKIRNSIGKHLTISGYFSLYSFEYGARSYFQKLRQIWIKKLLKHNGYL